MAHLLQVFAAELDPLAQPPPRRTITHKTPQKCDRRLAASDALYRPCGAGLTQVPSFQNGTALLLVGELLWDFPERFPGARHFASQLGLYPVNRITGARQHKPAAVPGIKLVSAQ